MIHQLLRYTRVLSIVGDILTVRASDVGLGELAMVENLDGHQSLAQVVEIQRDEVSLQVFTGGKGLSSESKVAFLGRSVQVTYSPNIMGRIFDGVGRAIDGGPTLDDDAKVEVGGPSVNPRCGLSPRTHPRPRCR